MKITVANLPRRTYNCTSRQSSTARSPTGNAVTCYMRHATKKTLPARGTSLRVTAPTRHTPVPPPATAADESATRHAREPVSARPGAHAEPGQRARMRPAARRPRSQLTARGRAGHATVGSATDHGGDNVWASGAWHTTSCSARHHRMLSQHKRSSIHAHRNGDLQWPSARSATIPVSAPQSTTLRHLAYAALLRTRAAGRGDRSRHMFARGDHQHDNPHDTRGWMWRCTALPLLHAVTTCAGRTAARSRPSPFEHAG